MPPTLVCKKNQLFSYIGLQLHSNHFYVEKGESCYADSTYYVYDIRIRRGNAAFKRWVSEGFKMQAAGEVIHHYVDVTHISVAFSVTTCGIWAEPVFRGKCRRFT
jgi:hypothetical protein